MSVVVFAGPSRPETPIPTGLDAELVPPAAVGDLLAVARRRPRAILLLDGYFEGRLPVWHKEILWAMAQGIHVFGAASMGALRAAELHTFGMVGVGRIFEDFRDGVLEGDDEVAVVHGPAELGYVAASEALVNVRATLQGAEEAGATTAAQTATLLAHARAIHYRERTWESILASPAETVAADRLTAWLPEGRVDLKRSDAEEALTAVAAFMSTDPPPLQVSYRLAWTEAWDTLYRGASGGHIASAVLDELRLDVEALAAVRQRALLRLLAGRERARLGWSPEVRLVQGAAGRLRERLGLWRQADLVRWVEVAGLDERRFQALLEEEAWLDHLAQEAGPALDEAMLAELRASGRYDRLAARAEEKARWLAESGLGAEAGHVAGVDLASSLGRLAERAQAQLGGSNHDLVGTLGFADRQALERAVLREVLFLRMVRNKADGSTQAAAIAQPAGSNGAKRER